MEWLERTELLLGRAKLDRLRQANVLIVGLGGVGAYAAEMICRAGVVLAQRLLDINPDLQLRTVGGFIKDEATYTLLDSEPYTYVVDAIDTLSPKAHLIKGCLDRGIPVVSSMGAGAKTDPTKVEIEDIARTHHCPLAHMLRKRLHKMGIHTGFQAVFSAEKIREGAMIIDEQTNKKSNTGTISYMPAVFGCCCASVVIRDLIGELR